MTVSWESVPCLITNSYKHLVRSLCCLCVIKFMWRHSRHICVPLKCSDAVMAPMFGTQFKVPMLNRAEIRYIFYWWKPRIGNQYGSSVTSQCVQICSRAWAILASFPGTSAMVLQSRQQGNRLWNAKEPQCTYYATPH